MFVKAFCSHLFPFVAMPTKVWSRFDVLAHPIPKSCECNHYNRSCKLLKTTTQLMLTISIHVKQELQMIYFFRCLDDDEAPSLEVLPRRVLVELTVTEFGGPIWPVAWCVLSPPAGLGA